MQTSLKDANLMIIYFGKFKDENIFHIGLDDSIYETHLQKIASGMYKNKVIKQNIYKYNNYYYDIPTYQYYKMDIVELKRLHNRLITLYNKQDVSPLDFECRLEYTKIDKEYQKFTINSHTNIYFNDKEKSIKIELEYNAYIKDNMKLVDSLFE
jgi:hypothetical protein